MHNKTKIVLLYFLYKGLNGIKPDHSQDISKGIVPTLPPTYLIRKISIPCCFTLFIKHTH